MGLADLRREYSLFGLDRSDLNPDPVLQFQRWFSEAAQPSSTSWTRRVGITLYKAFQALRGFTSVEPNAMVLATCDPAGQPSARTVLLKGVDQRGFVFFTNYESRKGHELAQNPCAALVFYWPALERQVCVRGRVSKLPTAESDAYFRSRPRGNRLGAWASRQSEVVASREALEEQWRRAEGQFGTGEIPLPPFWGGYVLAPEAIEFWQGRPSRMHDRFSYARQEGGGWRIDRLSP